MAGGIGMWGRRTAEEGDGPVGSRQDRLRVGLFIPLSGPAGIWGPSCQACAQLAAAELNQGGGIAGREVDLVLADAGDDPADVCERGEELLETGAIDAVVGMHISAVRAELKRVIGGQIPYVYTPLYEGGETTPGVYAIGETPAQQLRPAIAWLTEHRHLRRWVLVGNDYVWPRVSHGMARIYVHAAGAEVVDDLYLPLGTERFGPTIERIVEARPDAILLSLVGDDAVLFNRAFGAAGLGHRILRLSAAIEENELLAIGRRNTENLFSTAGYFVNVPTQRNLAFKERYRQMFGERAPVLNTMGESIYEGMKFLGALGETTSRRSGAPIAYASPRTAIYYYDRATEMPIYLAEADGHHFEIVASF